MELTSFARRLNWSRARTPWQYLVMTLTITGEKRRMTSFSFGTSFLTGFFLCEDFFRFSDFFGVGCTAAAAALAANAALTAAACSAAACARFKMLSTLFSSAS